MALLNELREKNGDDSVAEGEHLTIDLVSSDALALDGGPQSPFVTFGHPTTVPAVGPQPGDSGAGAVGKSRVQTRTAASPSLLAGEDAAAAGEPQLAPMMAERLKIIGALAREIGPLNRKRLAAIARGSDTRANDQARLQELTLRFAGHAAALNLHADRV